MARADAGRLEALLADLAEDGVSPESGDPLGDLLAALPELVPLDDPEGDPEDDDAGGDGPGAGNDDYEPSTRILLICRSSSQQEDLIDAIDRLAEGGAVAAATLKRAFRGVESKALNG